MNNMNLPSDVSAKTGLPTGEPGVAHGRDELAAKHFPHEWAAVVTKAGASKKRQQLRKRAEEAEKIVGLRADGARCANCRNFNTREIPGLKMKAHCDYMSDFDGYVEARPDEICVKWHQSSESETMNSQVGNPAEASLLR